MDDRVEVKFGADASGLEAGTSQATAVVDEATATWKEKFAATFESVSQSAKQMGTAVSEQITETNEKLESMSGFLGKIQKGMMLIGEVAMVGWMGEKIYGLVEKTAAWAEELEHAQQKIGVNTTAMQGLAAAATIYGSSTEGALTATRHIATSIMYAQEGMTTYTRAFDALGVSMEDINKSSPEEVILKVADAFKKHADGIGKAALAQQLFGRSGQQLIPLFDLGAAGIQKVMDKAQSMGAIMSKDDVEAAAKLKEQMEYLDLGMQGVKQRVSLQMLPAFNGLISAFEKSTEKGGQMDGILKMVSESVGFLARLVSYTAEAFQVLGTQIAGVAAAAVEAMHFHGAAAKEISRETAEDVHKIEAAAEEFRNSLSKPFKMGKMESPDGGTPGGGEAEGMKLPGFTFSATTGPLQEWRDALEKKKVLSDKYYADDKKEDLAFWQSKLALTKQGSKDWLAVEKEIYTLKKAIDAQERTDDEAKISQKQSMANLEVNLERAKLDKEHNLKQVSDEQYLAGEQDLENKRYQIDLAALRQKETLYKDDVKTFAQTQRQIEQLTLQHQVNMEKLFAKTKDPYANIFKAINKDMDQVVTGVLRGQTKMVNALKNLWNGMVIDFAKAGIKMVLADAQHQLAIVAAHKAGNAAKTADDEAAHTKTIALSMTTAIKTITADAASAAAGAFKAMAGIPYIGPILGAVAAAATFAGVMAFGSMASAEGGYDIPTGVNPVTQLHQEEMVLPASIANPLRNMAAGGGASMGNLQVNVSAMDARSVHQFFSGNGGRQLAKSLARQVRNFNGALNVG